jgi:DNA invertase Pin-like site-specific DNA recombinase
VTTVIAYARFSPQKDAGNKMSIQQQFDAIRESARLHGETVLDEYKDEYKSGASTKNRPGLRDAMVHAAESKSTLVVYSLSRFSRSTGDCIQLLESLRESGCGIRSITEHFDNNTPMGRLVFTMLSGFNQFFRESQAEITRGAARYRMKNGLKHGSRPPYGYRFEDKKMIPNADEQDTLERIFSYILRNQAAGIHVSAPLLAKHLNACRKRMRNGSKWTANNLYRILRKIDAEGPYWRPVEREQPPSVATGSV